MTIPIKTSTLSDNPQRQSVPAAPDAVILPAMPAASLMSHLMPLLDLLADLIARDILAQCCESDTSLEPEEGQAVTEVKPTSPLNREGGTSPSDFQIPINFSPKVSPESHHPPHVDDPVINKENKI
jgi:hypothetical protein